MVGFLMVVVFYFVPTEKSVQLYFFACILLLTGVPHGSLDYFVEHETLKNSFQKLSMFSFLVKYLFTMFIYGFFWFFFPVASLILFIGLTAFHFGEVDWPIRKNTFFDAILYTFDGLEVIAFIIASHQHEAAPVLELMVRSGISSATWVNWLAKIFVCLLYLLPATLISLALLHNKNGWSKKTLFQFIAQSILLLVVIYFLPLYLSFGFYFGLWHSLLSFNLIRKQLKLSDDWSGWKYLIKKALPFTLLAWLGMFILILVSSRAHSPLLILSNVFVGIAVLSLPHLQVFTKIKTGEHLVM